MRKSVWLLSAGLVALATPAFAQQTDTDGSTAQPTDGATAEAGAVSQTATQTDTTSDTGDIIVTATRRNEALSDVPLAVSAVTAETLKNTGATDIRQLTQVSPSLLVSSTSSEGGAAVARIRGVGTVGDNPGLESSVAVFVDGVYRSRTGVGLTELGAIDRIEVLRGPQGTLFGRNASAGLISVITAKPKFDPEVAGEISIGNYNYRRAQLSATGPISDTLAARVDGVYVKRDGFLNDVISGRDVNDRDRYIVRGQLLYTPSTDLSVRFIADYAKRNEECCAAPYLPAHDTVGGPSGVTYQPSTVAGLERALGAVISDDTYARNVSISPGRNYNSDVKDYGASAEIVYDFGGAELTSISAYRFNDFVRGQDADFNNLDLLYRDSDGGAANRFKTFTQEVRLQGTTLNDRLDWLVGGYYAHENLRVRDNLSYGNDFLRYANCLLIAGALPSALAPAPTGNCINAAVINGALGQLNGGIAQITAGINALSAIPNPSPAILAQIAALTAQRAGLQAQAQSVGLVSNGFTSIANALGIPGANPFAGVGGRDVYDQTSNNFALFTHNIFDLTDNMKLTIGARYTRERKRLDATLTDNNRLCAAVTAAAAVNPALNAVRPLACVIPSTPGGSFSGSSHKSEGKLSGTVVLSYKPTQELLTYASFSRGYKAGGFNLDRTPLLRSGGNGAILSSASLDDLQFDPEINNAFELGMKYNGRGLDVNVALFHQRFKDFQLNQFNGLAFEVENINSCSRIDVPNGDIDPSPTTGNCLGKVKSGVRSTGVEFELFSRPMTDVQFNLGATYSVTKYKRHVVGADGEAVSPQLFQLAGHQISNAAEFTGTASLAWTPRIGDSGMRALFYVDARHMSGFNTGSDLDVEKHQDGFNTVNGRIGLNGPDQRWGIELWAQNLFDVDYKQVAFDAPLQGNGTGLLSNTERGVRYGYYPRANQLFGAFLGEPRTYGLTLRGKFGAAHRAMPAYVAPPAPPPPAPATQTCADGSVIDATAACPVAPPPPPPPAPAPERG